MGSGGCSVAEVKDGMLPNRLPRRVPGIARTFGNSVPESTPEWIRTTNLRLRRPTLYPVELRGQFWGGTTRSLTSGFCFVNDFVASGA